MKLKVINRERKNGVLINTCELLAKKSATPCNMEIWFFDELPIRSYTSQAELITKYILNEDIDKPNYIVDSLAAWKILEGGKTLKIIIIGEKGKRKALRLITYLCKEYKIKLNNITLGFEDKNFISQLVNSLNY